MNRIRRGAAALLLAATLPLPLAAAGTAVAAPAPPAAHTTSPTAPDTHTRLELPRPTGPYAVGRDTLPLTDTHRKDPWVPSAGPRELMASMYYPARPGTGGARSPYMSTEEARLLLEGTRRTDALPPEQLAATRTHARSGARAIGGKHPLVGVVEKGDDIGTTFRGGRTLTCVACDTVGQAPEKTQRKLMAKVATGRAADISFVIDTLTAAPDRHHVPAWRHSAMIDPKRIGTAGHSIGGNSAASAMAADHRIRAGVNMDGTFFAPVPRSGLDGRPFLMLGGLNGHAPGDEDTSWLRDWRRLDGWKRWLTVRDAGHFTFIDLPVLGEQLGVTDPNAPLSGKRSGEITRDYVTAFFDQQLRGIPRPLLDGPSAANPEAVFQKP
ncbi:alpha/beta hydrolase family protein [Streptomyces nigrescens]